MKIKKLNAWTFNAWENEKEGTIMDGAEFMLTDEQAEELATALTLFGGAGYAIREDMPSEGIVYICPAEKARFTAEQYNKE